MFLGAIPPPTFVDSTSVGGFDIILYFIFIIFIVATIAVFVYAFVFAFVLPSQMMGIV